MKLKHKLKELFKTKREKWEEKLRKDYEEGNILKIGGEINPNRDGK